jgi:hypothetical protein
MKQDNIPAGGPFLERHCSRIRRHPSYRLQQKLDQPVLGPIGITSDEVCMGMVHVANVD